MKPRSPLSSLPGALMFAALLGAGCTLEAPGASPPPPPAAEPSAPAVGVTTQALCSDYNPYKNVYWGDLHTHTSYSVDAYAFRTRNTPQDAHAFARGAPKQIAAGDPNNPGPMVQLNAGRLLDFNAVTDHSEWLPTSFGCGASTSGTPYDPSSPYYTSASCQYYRSDDLTFTGAFLTQVPICGNSPNGTPECTAELRSAWQAEQQAANQAYVPCTYTTFNGYEWTSSQDGATLHRNVIFSSEVVPPLPYTALDYTDPEQLWTALDQGCQASEGCEALTIPHNTNQSNGLAFDLPGNAGPAVMEQARRYQRLVEIHQHKGNSECSPPDAGTSPDAGPDSVCNFEQLSEGAPPQAYVRSGLTKGLAIQALTGTNPFRLGIVGATDNHNGMPGSVSEASWNGHVGNNDNTPARRLLNFPDENPGGITGVWAEQNTRPSLFAALKRREVFATSGPRIKVRLFQTWSSTNFCTATYPQNIINAGGVPMGGTLSANPGNGNPYFVVSAVKDLVDLARIDIIKVDIVNGQPRQRVIPFELTGTQKSTACLTWQDPEYVAGAPAFYYARVLQAATPRWSAYDCDQLGALAPAGCDPGGRFREPIQERAWTSPIWSMP
jgi:hypothetical protein